jgi:thiamine pyrophosphate-dependent acetolactate synthase large subunit-like protein
MKSWNQLMEVRGTRTETPMKPQVVTWNLNKLLDDDAIVSSDSGTIATWSARYIEIRGDMKFSLSGSLATMANGLPYSIGAAVAFPGRQVVCIVGDGGLTMLMGEIATLVKYKLPVKVIVIKNNVLGQIKWEQMVMEGNPEYGVELEPIDFAAIAKACGAAGTRSKIRHTRLRYCVKRWRTKDLRWYRPLSIPTSRPLRAISVRSRRSNSRSRWYAAKKMAGKYSSRFLKTKFVK